MKNIGEHSGYAVTLVFIMISSSASAELVTCSNIFEMDEWSDSQLMKVDWVDEVFVWKEGERISKVMYVRGLEGLARTREIDCIKEASIDQDHCFRESALNSHPQQFSYEVVRFLKLDPDNIWRPSDKVIRRPVYEITHSSFTLEVNTQSGLPTFFNSNAKKLPGYFDCDIFSNR